MKVFRFLFRFYFLFFVFSCLSVQAQKGGTSQGCKATWTYTGFIASGDEFIGTGSAATTITNFSGSGVNGWVNFVVDGTGTTSATYQMTLELGTTPYKIVYKAPRLVGSPPFQIQQYGLLEVYVANSAIYSSQLTGTENRAVFRIAREGNVMRFYKNDVLIPISTTVNADMGANATMAVATNSIGRIRVTLFSPFCQTLVPEFASTPIDCTSGTGELSVSSVQGGTAPYFHYFDDIALDNIQSIPSPTVGWITTVDQAYRAATYYMGVGKSITWQHIDTQLNGNLVTSLTSSSSALPSNILPSQEEGWLGFRKENATGWSVSFIDATTSTSLYEFRAINSAYSGIYIGGNYVTDIQALLTDYLRISKEGSSIKFYVNEVEVYSQSLLSSVDLKTKFGFTQLGSSISYPTLSFCISVAPPVISLASTNLSACQYENVPVITPTTQNVTELRWYTTNPDGVFPRPSYVSGASFDPDPSYPTPYLAAGVHTYYVTGVDLNGQETPSQAITLTVHTLPIISISPIPPLCPGNSAILNVTSVSGATYQWYKNNDILTNQTGTSLTITEAATYKVEVSLTQGCVITRVYNAVYYSLPTLTLNYANGIGCGFTTLRATLSGGYTVYYVEMKNSNGSWTHVNVNGAGSNRNQFTLPQQPNIPGIGTNTYRIYYQDIITGCRSYSNELAVTVHSLPQATIYSNPVCQGEDVTLGISNYTPSYSYQWQQQLGGSWTNVGTTQSITIPYLIGTTSANFQVIMTDRVTGCSRTIPSTISYVSSPTITYTSFVEAEVGETIDFEVGVAQNTNYNYIWTGPNNYYYSTTTNPNPPILVNQNSYGEYTLIVRNSNGTCPTTYRAILAEKGIFATLKENLDASYYHTNREGKLYFKFDEKYGAGATGLASVSIFNYDFQEVNQTNLSKVYGYNWYELDLSSFGIEGDHYVLHIRDELDRRYVLRVKYATGDNKVIISEDSEICISQNTDSRSIRLDAKSYVDSSPYSIKWYTSATQNDITQLETNTNRENLLFYEESNLNSQPSSAYFETRKYYLNPPNNTTIYAPDEGLYYVRAIITDFCGNVAYSNLITVKVYIGTGCRIAANEIPAKEKHRFQIFFSIRRLLFPKATPTDPNTR